MKPINTCFYDFPTLIEGGYVYVDKTAILYEIARPGTDGIYYLPRPRRFGKSLMISTLKALFQGRRELFRGLKIERTDWDWEKEVYPVVHLDMSKASSSNAAEEVAERKVRPADRRVRRADRGAAGLRRGPGRLRRGQLRPQGAHVRRRQDRRIQELRTQGVML